MEKARQFNSNLGPLSQYTVKYFYGQKHLSNPTKCSLILDKLNLKSQYTDSDKLKIMDIFTGPGLFSTMLNKELSPKQHLIMNKDKDYVKFWSKNILPRQTTENFDLYKADGYDWLSYSNLIEKEKRFVPEKQNFDQLHSTFLIHANLTNTNIGEPLLAQWCSCINNKNWLQRYGRVRMLVWVLDGHAKRMTSRLGDSYRTRNTAILDLVSDTKLVAITDPDEVVEGVKMSKNTYNPQVLKDEKPIRLSSSDIGPDSKGGLALLDIQPKASLDIDLDIFEYVSKHLFVSSAKPLGEVIGYLGPGSYEWFKDRLYPEIWNKDARQLTSEDFQLICREFFLWPFKPQVLLSFYDQEISKA